MKKKDTPGPAIRDPAPPDREASGYGVAGGRLFTALAITGTALLVWGRVLGMDGLWWDDWAWAWHYFGSHSTGEFMEPFVRLRHMAVGYMMFVNLRLLDLLGWDAMKVWGAMRLLVYALNASLLYAITANVVGGRSALPLAAALLFLASPVVNNLCMVTNDYNALLALYLGSVLLCLKAVGGGRLRLAMYLSSVLLAAFSMAALESFVFFEPVRAAAISAALSRQTGKGLGASAKKALPYFLPFAASGALVLLDTALRPQSGAYAGIYSAGPISISYIKTVISRYADSLEYIFLKVYLITAKYALIKNFRPLPVLISAGAATFCSWLLLRFARTCAGGDENRVPLSACLFGLFAALAGVFPYALTREAVAYGLQSRHGILANVGATVFWASLCLALYSSGPSARRVFVPLVWGLVFLGALQCNYAMGDYEEHWEHQRSIWWQLIWRAPDLKANTLLIIDMPWPESPGGGSFALPAAMNMAYAKSREASEVFGHFALEMGNALRPDEAYNFRENSGKDMVEFLSYRGPLRFYPKNLIAASYKDGLLFLDGEMGAPVRGEAKDVAFLASKAAGDRIIHDDAGSSFPLRWLLGPEPPHDERYYYQRGSALYEMGDPVRAMALYEEARASGLDLSLESPQALLPFAKASYLAGDREGSHRLIKSWASSKAGGSALCIPYAEKAFAGVPGLHEEALGRPGGEAPH